MTISLIDVDGYKLAIDITGTGTPPVIMASSWTGNHSEWQKLIPLLSETTCVTYGRPGLGSSEPVPIAELGIPRPASWFAKQLRSLLRNAGILPPYILVGASLSGFIIDLFAHTWPDEVAGLVFVDPTKFVPWPEPYVSWNVSPDSAKGDGAVFDYPESLAELTNTIPQTSKFRSVVIASSVGRWLRLDQSEWGLPLETIDSLWQHNQREWAKRWNAPLLVADSAGHIVHHDQPELVTYAITVLQHSLTHNTDLKFDAEKAKLAGGTLYPNTVKGIS